MGYNLKSQNNRLITSSCPHCGFWPLLSFKITPTYCLHLFVSSSSFSDDEIVVRRKKINRKRSRPQLQLVNKCKFNNNLLR